jgi:hypothetical protein
MKVYIRTCQECGHQNKTNPPNMNDTKERWREAKCRKCKSESLDFGGEKIVPPISEAEQLEIDASLDADFDENFPSEGDLS